VPRAVETDRIFRRAAGICFEAVDQIPQQPEIVIFGIKEKILKRHIAILGSTGQSARRRWKSSSSSDKNIPG